MNIFSKIVTHMAGANRLLRWFSIWLLLLLGHSTLWAQLNVNIFTNTKVDVTGGAKVNVSGNWTNQGNLIFDDGTLVFTGQGNQTLSSPNTETFSGFIVNKPGGTLTVNFKMIVTENLALLDGTFNNSGFDVILDEGAFLIRDGGTIVKPPLTSGRESFWPANHKYKTIDMRNFFGPDVIITRATSDEPDDAQGDGDGNTKNDIVILNDCKRINLRSERQGSGNGRVYTVYVSLDNGATTSALSRFIVPHDKKDTMAGVDEDAHTVSCNPNLALNRPATASSTNGSDAPGKAVDGSTGSYWRSGNLGSTTVCWWRVALNGTQTVAQVVIKWKDDYYAKKYQVQVSSNDVNWTTVYTTTSGNGGTDDITFAAVSAQFVRVYMTEHKKSSERITEVEVYASAAALPKETDEDPAVTALPDEIILHKNYPNPFNPQTTIAYDLPQAGLVRLVVYDILGRAVRTLIDETQPAGTHRVIWDGRNESGQQVGSGIYIYRMQAGNQVLVKQMLLVK